MVTKKKDPYSDIEKAIDLQYFIESVNDSFHEVKDPRSTKNQTYPLMSLLTMILCAVIAGANSITAIHHYVKIKIHLFTNLIGCQKTPSYTVFWWLLTRMEPEPLMKAFMDWVSKLPEETKSRLIAIDGKHLNGLLGDSSIHLVGAWDCYRGLLLGQVKAEEKSNEVTAIPKLLEIIDIKGATITIDAAGCQKDIARKIREKGGDYILALKGNQGTLHAGAVNFFLQAEAAGFANAGCTVGTTLEKGHGRIEERRIAVIDDLEWLEKRDEWKDLSSIIEITTTRLTQGHESTERRYYISSKKATPDEAGIAVRGHWSIENHLHWTMDVTFKEDASLANTGHAGENLAMFRRLAHALIKEDVGGNVGVASRRREAAWDDTCTLRILGRLFRMNGKSF